MKGFMKTITTLVIGMMLGSATLAAAAPSTVQAVISNLKILVNGKEQILKNKQLVVNGTTYLPVRDVAEITGKQVNFANGVIYLNDVKEQTAMKDDVQWFLAREIVEQYDVKITMDTETTVSYQGTDIVFPVSMYDKKENEKIYSSNDGAASLKFGKDGILLGEDTLKLLGI